MLKVSILWGNLKRYFILIFVFFFCFNNTFGQLYINEFLAANTSTNIDSDFGNYNDWVEIFNDGDKEIDISGYYLTDDLKKSDKWKIPENTIIKSKEFKIFWTDGKNCIPGSEYLLSSTSYPPSKAIIKIKNYHASFKLNNEGGKIGLFNFKKELIDSVSYKEQVSDVSYGRTFNNKTIWCYFDKPTPCVANINNGCEEKIIAQNPKFFPEGGSFKGEVIVKITKTQEMEVRYTTDGSIPDDYSFVYTKPIVLDSTTTIRARVFEKDKLKSKIVTHTYFINDNFSIPVISIATDPFNLWDDYYGIYVKGKNGISLIPFLGTGNFYQNWERPANIELFEPNEEKCSFNVNAGIEIVGLAGSSNPKKSLSIKLSDKYGDKKIYYPLFNDKPINSFETFVLRAGQDMYTTKFSDGMMNVLLIGEMDIDYQAYRPCLVFINGKYWGIHNMREKLNENYIKTNYNIKPDKFDMIEANPFIENHYIASVGDLKSYNNLLDFITKNDLSIAKNYEYIKTQIDINEYINYQIAELYYVNTDWPFNNRKFWKSKDENGKWRWILCDLDAGFAKPYSDLPYKSSFDLDVFELLTMENVENEYQNINFNVSWSTILFRNLIKNPEFRSDFIQGFANYLNTTFKSERVIKIIDSLKRNIEPEINLDINRWGGETKSEWEQYVQNQKEFALNRPKYVYEHIIKTFQLNGIANLNILVSKHGSGKVMINNKVVTDDSFTGKYFLGDSLEIHLKAIPNIGYKFIRWEGISENDSTSLNLKGDTVIKAVFEPLK